MSSRDYLVDYFKQLGEVLAAVFEKQKRAKYNEAIKIINHALNVWLKVDAERFEEYQPEEIDKIFQHSSNNLEHEKAISELFYQKFVTFREMKQNEKALHAAQSTVYIIEKVEKLTESYSFEDTQRVVELQEYISGANNK